LPPAPSGSAASDSEAAEVRAAGRGVLEATLTKKRRRDVLGITLVDDDGLRWCPLIRSVAPGGLAARAGVEAGLRLVSIDGVRCRTHAEGTRLLRAAKHSVTLRMAASEDCDLALAAADDGAAAECCSRTRRRSLAERVDPATGALRLSDLRAGEMERVLHGVADVTALRENWYSDSSASSSSSSDG
jgi:C-terminal processing protease CtpA/Prc